MVFYLGVPHVGGRAPAASPPRPPGYRANPGCAAPRSRSRPPAHRLSGHPETLLHTSAGAGLYFLCELAAVPADPACGPSACGSRGGRRGRALRRDPPADPRGAAAHARALRARTWYAHQPRSRSRRETSPAGASGRALLRRRLGSRPHGRVHRALRLRGRASVSLRVRRTLCPHRERWFFLLVGLFGLAVWTKTPTADARETAALRHRAERAPPPLDRVRPVRAGGARCGSTLEGRGSEPFSGGVGRSPRRRDGTVPPLSEPIDGARNAASLSAGALPASGPAGRRRGGLGSRLPPHGGSGHGGRAARDPGGGAHPRGRRHESDPLVARVLSAFSDPGEDSAWDPAPDGRDPTRVHSERGRGLRARGRARLRGDDAARSRGDLSAVVRSATGLVQSRRRSAGDHSCRS